jgi:hypothetical protein
VITQASEICGEDGRRSVLAAPPTDYEGSFFNSPKGLDLSSSEVRK